MPLSTRKILANPSLRIEHKNLEPHLRRLRAEPYFRPGPPCPRPAGIWYMREVWLLVALGELAEDGLKTLALRGRYKLQIVRVPTNARLCIQGLEGCCIIHKPLMNALFNLRDLIPLYRGCIVCPEGKP